MFYDREGRTLSVWFDDPKKEVISEEIGDGTIVSKDKKGKIIGFEKLLKTNFININLIS